MFINTKLKRSSLFDNDLTSHHSDNSICKTTNINDFAVQLISTVSTPFRTEVKSDFFLNNQLGAPIIPMLFCYKTLHVSGIFSAHNQEFSTVHSALVSFVRVSDDRFQTESGWNWQFHPDVTYHYRYVCVHTHTCNMGDLNIPNLLWGWTLNCTARGFRVQI